MSPLALPEPEQESHSSGLNLHEVLFIVFRHKWKILLLAVGGIAAAASIYLFLPPDYESQAKLLVRYVVERSAVDGVGTKTDQPVDYPSENLINSEVEILTSSDLAIQVAETIGADRILKGSPGQITNNAAAVSIIHGLEVNAVKGSNILSITYKNKDPKLAVAVLDEVVKRYLQKHLEVHRSLDTFEFVSREADQLKAQLTQTEEELKQLKDKYGITSLQENLTAVATELTKAQEDLDGSQFDLAAQQARVSEIEKLISGDDTKQSESNVSRVSTEVVDQYQGLITRLGQLRQVQAELLSKFTPQNRIVKVKQAQLDDLEKQRRDLEKKNPTLVGTVAAGGASQGERPDLLSERARLAAIQTKIESLKSRVASLKQRSQVLSDVGPKVAQLERTRDVEETNYRYYGASLEKARIDETLDPARMPNISVVQTPSPAVKATRDVKKIVMGLAGGGLAVGIGIALVIELVVDRTIKRPFELETRLQLPLLLSIPNLNSNGQRLRLHDVGDDPDIPLGSSGANGNMVGAGELLRPFCEAIRDRLGLYFEVNRMTHKPKLIAVTSLSKNAGASTLAAGLAASLSESGDGRVLLVDKPVAAKRFYDMMTEFKASDLDYIVFDMPSLGDTSSTLPMAGFMDKVLLVVEAEKSNRNAVKRAYAQLAARADVSVVFNKSRVYGPKWLQGEL
jgi:succinoglycan biosynthesis transport protein ExoP